MDFLNNTKILILLISSFFVLIIGFVWLIVLSFKIKNIKTFYNNFFKGKNGMDLEKVILEQSKEQKILRQDFKNVSSDMDNVRRLAKTGLRKVGFVRYNSFRDVGGEQSFSIAVLDNSDDGFIISSIHGRGSTRIYAKPIKKGRSEFTLSNEEQMSVDDAIKNKL